MKKQNSGVLVLIILAFLSVILMCLLPPIRQSSNYHKFCDEKILFGIPNFLNVVSNFPFFIVGIIGLCKIKRYMDNKLIYIVFFVGIMLVSVGSAYYHYNPTTQRLLWDRLPMTIAFMALFSILINEFINERVGQILLVPFLVVGVVSIIIWMIYDDLRMYALVQFYPILAIPVILLFYNSRSNVSKPYWLLLLTYIVAKFCEYFDEEVYGVLKIVSGHSLKHIIAASGVYLFIYFSYKTKLKLHKN